jgi:hypothetical protein
VSTEPPAVCVGEAIAARCSLIGRLASVTFFDAFSSPLGRRSLCHRVLPDVCQILDTAVAGEPVMALHGAFWRRLDRDAFRGHTVIFAGGEIPLVRRGDGANSALVQALRGTSPFVGFRMPVMRGQVSPSDIQRIEEWIDHGCP